MQDKNKETVDLEEIMNKLNEAEKEFSAKYKSFDFDKFTKKATNQEEAKVEADAPINNDVDQNAPLDDSSQK